MHIPICDTWCMSKYFLQVATLLICSVLSTTESLSAVVNGSMSWAVSSLEMLFSSEPTVTDGKRHR
jgi:hypothetical protein